MENYDNEIEQLIRIFTREMSSGIVTAIDLKTTFLT